MAQYSVNWSAPVSPAAGPIAVGQCVVTDTTGKLVVATAINRATYGRADGVASTAGDSSNPIAFIDVGPIPTSISGLGAGTASWVRVKSDGTLERCTPSGSDDVVGWCEADGRLHANFGIIPLGGYAAAGSSFTAGGDLTGTSTSQTVAKVNGSSVPAGGALTTGNVLQVSGASALSYGPVNLAGGAGYVTGTLPVGNGGTGITSLGTGIATWLGTPSGANLASALTSALPATKGGTGLTALGTNVSGFLGTSLATGYTTFAATPSGANLASLLTSALPVSKGGTGLTALGTGLQVLRTNAGATAMEWATVSGSGSPGGSDTQVLFNDGGVSAGNSAFTFNKTTGMVTASIYLPSGSIGTAPPAAGMLRASYVGGDTNTFGFVSVNGAGTDYDFLSLSLASSRYSVGNVSWYTDVKAYCLTLTSQSVSGTIYDGLSGETGELLTIGKALSANFTTTSASATATNLTFAMGASEVWEVEFFGNIQCSSTGGVKFSLTVPTNCVNEGAIDGIAGALTSRTAFRWTGTATTGTTGASSAFCTAAIAGPVHGFIRLKGDGVNAGSVTLNAQSGVAAQTTTLFAGFYMRARRVTEV